MALRGNGITATQLAAKSCAGGKEYGYNVPNTNLGPVAGNSWNSVSATTALTTCTRTMFAGAVVRRAIWIAKKIGTANGRYTYMVETAARRPGIASTTIAETCEACNPRLLSN